MIGYLVAFVFVNILVTPDVLAGAKTYGATKPYTLEQRKK